MKNTAIYSFFRHIAYNLAKIAVSHMHMSNLIFASHKVFRRHRMLVVLTYHRVIDRSETNEFYTNYDRGLDYRIFENHIIALKKHFKLVSLEEFIEIASSPNGPKEHTALLTFDDADSNLHDYVTPILQKHNAPSIVMAPIVNVGEQTQLWHVRISNILKSATQENWETMQIKTAPLSQKVTQVLLDHELPPAQARRPVALEINKACDHISHETIDKIVNLWESIVQPTNHIPIRSTNWDELKQLQDDGIDVESHTISHRKLTTLTDDEIMYELIQSKNILEDKLNKNIYSVAYPQGYYNEAICRMTEQAGYKIGFTTKRHICTTPIKGLDLMRIPRIGMNGETVSEVELFLSKLCMMSTLYGASMSERRAV